MLHWALRLPSFSFTDTVKHQNLFNNKRNTGRFLLASYKENMYVIKCPIASLFTL